MLAYESIGFLVDHDRDGVITMDSGLVDEIITSLSQEYEEDEIENLKNASENFSLINEEIALFILSDQSTNLSNLFSWNLDKYFD